MLWESSWIMWKPFGYDLPHWAQWLKNAGIDGLDYHYSVFLDKHPDWILEAKKLGLITNVWTVNDEVIFKKLADLGVGFVTTNVPDVLK